MRDVKEMSEDVREMCERCEGDYNHSRNNY